MKLTCDMCNSDSVTVGRRYSNSGVFIAGFESDRKTTIALTREDACKFALEILRLCGDEQPAPADKAEPKASKAIVVQKLLDGRLAPSARPYVHASVSDAITEARWLAETVRGNSFVVFTPVAEAKATVTVDLTHTPTI